MKINKKILLASMLVTNLVSAQEYYTCVPKKDWWKNMIKEQKKEEWKLVSNKPVIFRGALLDSLINLEITDYKLKLIKNNRVIAQQNMNVNRKDMYIYYSNWKCECGEKKICEGGLNFGEEETRKVIILNRPYFARKLLENCEGSSPKKFAVILGPNDHNGYEVLFAVITDSDEDLTKYFKDTTLEVWKKVEY